jgi:hypothetical protein
MGTEAPAGEAPAAAGPVAEPPTPEPPAPAGLERFKLTAGTDSCIVYDEKNFGRYEMKTFFASQMDEAGNLAYQYCDQEIPMLKFFLKDGVFWVSGPSNIKNHFLLNGKKVEAEVMLNNGDKFELFSTGKSAVICALEVVKLG